MAKAIIQDFDGTIADTTESIMMSVRYTAKVLGVQIDELATFDDTDALWLRRIAEMVWR